LVKSTAKTVAEYLRGLPAARRTAIEAVRAVILKNLPDGFVESMQYGMIGYSVPLDRLPDTYNGQPWIAGLASQKHYMSVYLMNIYSDPRILAWFQKEYRASGKRLDMGKSCVRFRRLDDLALELIGKAVARNSVRAAIAAHERSHGKR